MSASVGLCTVHKLLNLSAVPAVSQCQDLAPNFKVIFTSRNIFTTALHHIMGVSRSPPGPAWVVVRDIIVMLLWPMTSIEVCCFHPRCLALSGVFIIPPGAGESSAG